MSNHKQGSVCGLCGETAIPAALKGRGHVVLRCPVHRLLDDWTSDEARPLTCGETFAWMDPEERAWLLTSACRIFLDEATDKGTLVIVDLAHGDQYVQFEYHDGAVYGEVGSRQWDCPDCGNQPLDPDAVWALSLAGFVGGGVHRNYSKDGLPKTALELAALTESLFAAAYGPPADFEILVQHKSPETLARLRLQMELERGGWLN